jgi:hypothetical protein
MTPVTVERQVGADGVLHLDLPLGVAEAGRTVQVAVTPIPPPMTQAEWAAWVDSMAGSWHGDFEEPPDLPFEEREPLE